VFTNGVNIECLSDSAATDVYAIVWVNKVSYRSNTITFENTVTTSGLAERANISISISYLDAN
jgi:hypothetical protein